MEKAFELYDALEGAEAFELMPEEIQLNWINVGSTIGSGVIKLIESEVGQAIDHAKKWGFFLGVRYTMQLVAECGIIISRDDLNMR